MKSEEFQMIRGSTASNRTSLLMNPNIPFSSNRLLQLIIVISVIFWGVMAVSPTDRTLWLIENLLVIVTVLALVFTYRKFRFSNLSYLWMFIFLCLHTYAAHYTYQNTPLDMWLKTSFHTQRSYYDRVVHFAFGLFLAYPLREWLIRLTRLRGFLSYAIPTAVILALSSLFEIIEMLVAAIAGQVGEKYIGLQGDIFDTQKDMGLGFIGGLISMGCLAWIHRLSGEKKNK
jgi:putative membrane protein